MEIFLAGVGVLGVGGFALIFNSWLKSREASARSSGAHGQAAATRAQAQKVEAGLKKQEKVIRDDTGALLKKLNEEHAERQRKLQKQIHALPKIYDLPEPEVDDHVEEAMERVLKRQADLAKGDK